MCVGFHRVIWRRLGVAPGLGEEWLEPAPESPAVPCIRKRVFGRSDRLYDRGSDLGPHYQLDGAMILINLLMLNHSSSAGTPMSAPIGIIWADDDVSSRIGSTARARNGAFRRRDYYTPPAPELWPTISCSPLLTANGVSVRRRGQVGCTMSNSAIWACVGIFAQLLGRGADSEFALSLAWRPMCAGFPPMRSDGRLAAAAGCRGVETGAARKRCGWRVGARKFVVANTACRWDRDSGAASGYWCGQLLDMDRRHGLLRLGVGLARRSVLANRRDRGRFVRAGSFTLGPTVLSVPPLVGIFRKSGCALLIRNY